MASTADIASTMIASLGVTEPGLDTSVGTPLRKIIDVFAEALSEAYVDTHLLTYQYDIDAKSDAALDDFVSLFGFTRLPATRATGTVTFSRTTPGTTAVIVGVGTQVSTVGATVVSFSTTVPAVLPAGLTQVTVPVQATVGGESGNVLAGTLVALVSTPDGVGAVTNNDAATGGTNVESDDQLRARFKATVFRSLAGTEAQFRGTALENPYVTQVNVVGASKHFREQVQVSGGTATSILNEAAYIYPSSSTFGPDIDGGDILTPGINYTFDPTQNPPVVSTIGATYVDSSEQQQNFQGGIFDLDYEYLPAASRNDPAHGVTNRIDVFVNGLDAEQATQSIAFNASFARVFTSDPTSEFYSGNYQRVTGAAPTVGNRFLPLSFGPIVALPPQIIIGTTSYTLNTHYWAVADKTPFGGAFGSLAGIEWSAYSLPANGSSASVTYTYNQVPKSVADAIEAWKLVGKDLTVHQARERLLRLNLIVMYTNGFSADSVNSDIVTALSGLFAAVGFNAVLQVSDVLEVVHEVQGVDNVRFRNAADGQVPSGGFFSVSGTGTTPTTVGYAIQEIAAYTGTGTSPATILQTFQAAGYATDVVFGDADVPALDSVYIEQRAQNTFNRALS